MVAFGRHKISERKNEVALSDMADEESRSESDFDSDSGPEDIPLSEPSKKAVYNREGLAEKLEDIRWPENTEWIHRLTIEHDHGQDINVNDDIIREMAFYSQALGGTREAFVKLQSLGILFFRPPDFYAEMVKTDSHMLKVKGKLLVQKQKIEETEERKKARETKKIAKEVQAQKLKERAKTKKEDIESVKRWRKQRQKSGFAGGKDSEFDLDFNENKGFGMPNKRRPGVAPGDRTGGFRGKQKRNPKRERRDLKFGSGGRKGMKKQNTSESTNDFRGFNRGDNPANKRRRK